MGFVLRMVFVQSLLKRSLRPIQALLRSFEMESFTLLGLICGRFNLTGSLRQTAALRLQQLTPKIF